MAALNPPSGGRHPGDAAPQAKTPKSGAPSEIHILWINAGLSCDGDSVSITAAEQPSIEMVALQGIPGLPKVHLHNPVLAKENGEEFLVPFRRAAKGELGAPYVLVVEGSIPNERVKEEGYWAAWGEDLVTHQPILTTQWIDWLAPGSVATIAIGTCAAYGGIHAMDKATVFL